MSTRQQEPADRQVPPDVYARLAAATPEERASLALQLIAEHVQHRLSLPARPAGPAVLNGVDLSPLALERQHRHAAEPAGWWPDTGQGLDLRNADLRGAQLRRANLQAADLSGAQLQDAALGGANLAGATLENADLRGADLAGADLHGADLDGASLQQALLEDASLSDASLRFVDLRDASLENADLQRADLWGASLAGADLQHARLQHAVLRDANLQGAGLELAGLELADLDGADLQQARLSGANLQGAALRGANLGRAVLRDAQLQGISLLSSELTHAYFSGAWLERTRLQQKQLGAAIGEELDGEYEAAAYGYLSLERNFITLGDTHAASWAYRKRRRMQKLEARKQARLAWAAGAQRRAAGQYTRYAVDQGVEWLCDYGESIPRVLYTLLAVYVFYTALYGITGSVVRVVETPQGVEHVVTSNIIDLAAFSLVAISTSGSPAVGVLPAHQAVHLLTASEALLCIALTGLLGFVIGNRIRR